MDKHEPVAYEFIPNGELLYPHELERQPDADYVPLYAAPPKREWVGLTDEEIDHIWGITKPDYEDLFDFPRAIEAKLRAKNGF